MKGVSAASSSERANIIYLHSHDTGRYISPYGYAVHTPNLHALAEDAVVFRQAFSAAPTCSPSRAALLTGQTPHNSGMMGLAHRGWRLSRPHQHLAHTLGGAGYHTALGGIQHLAPEPEVAALGFHERFGRGGREQITAAAERFLEREHTAPFFLDVGFSETHLRPGGVSSFGHARGDPRYARPPSPVPDTPETRQDMADFGVAVTWLDAAYGRILGALERSGAAQNTLLICTTDHGLPLPGMKGTLSDHGLGVLLLIRGPGFRGGRVVEGLVSQLDIFPTICDLLRLPPPNWLQGRSLLPLVRGESSHHEAIFAESTHHVAYEPQRSVRTARYRYVRQFAPRGKPVPSNTDDTSSKRVWLERGWLERTVPEETLFDLTFDPNEAHNVATDPAYAAVLMDLRQQLLAWMTKTADPLLQGAVPVPAGTPTKDPDAISPEG